MAADGLEPEERVAGDTSTGDAIAAVSSDAANDGQRAPTPGEGPSLASLGSGCDGLNHGATSCFLF
jgi:hypothetical protein